MPSFSSQKKSYECRTSPRAFVTLSKICLPFSNFNLRAEAGGYSRNNFRFYQLFLSFVWIIYNLVLWASTQKGTWKELILQTYHMYYYLFYLFGILDILKIRQCGGFSLGFVHCGGQHNPPNHLLVEPRCYHGDGGNYTGR